MPEKSFVCSICGCDIVNEYGNNAQPVNNGRCCEFVVIPRRLGCTSKHLKNARQQKSLIDECAAPQRGSGARRVS
jgi:hypothetical protein